MKFRTKEYFSFVFILIILTLFIQFSTKFDSGYSGISHPNLGLPLENLKLSYSGVFEPNLSLRLGNLNISWWQNELGINELVYHVHALVIN